jgi:hypothetical protein
MLPHWTCSNPLFHQSVHCCEGQITILLEWIGLEVLTFSWAPSMWEPHFAQPQIELQEPHTFDPTWASLWDIRSSSHLQEPDSCKVKIEGSESQSCCYSWFNTMIRTYTRNVCTSASPSVFLFLCQFYHVSKMVMV